MRWHRMEKLDVYKRQVQNEAVFLQRRQGWNCHPDPAHHVRKCQKQVILFVHVLPIQLPDIQLPDVPYR